MSQMRLIISCFFILFFAVFRTLSAQSSEKELHILSNSDSLFGTLLMPENAKAAPIALIISGSGPTDRNGNTKPYIINNSLALLANGLASHGIGSFRFDKRGVGKSNSKTKEEELLFDRYVEDVCLWIDLIKKEFPSSKLFIIGHSEGSLIGILAARKRQVNGFVSLCGVAKRADHIILEQLQTLPPPLLDSSKRIIDSLIVGKKVYSIPSELKGLFRPSVQPYLISWFKYTPSEEIKALKIPILVIQGKKDIQVSEKEGELLQKASLNAEALFFEHMNHVLKECKGDYMENAKTYTNPSLPLYPTLISSLEAFINRN